MKTINHGLVTTTIAVVLMGTFSLSGPANAEHELLDRPQQEQPKDPHLTWHQFEHELMSLGNIQAVMSHEGVLTLTGHVDSGIEKNQIESLARKVFGVIKIRNLIFTD